MRAGESQAPHKLRRIYILSHKLGLTHCRRIVASSYGCYYRKKEIHSNSLFEFSFSKVHFMPQKQPINFRSSLISLLFSKQKTSVGFLSLARSLSELLNAYKF